MRRAFKYYPAVGCLVHPVIGLILGLYLYFSVTNTGRTPYPKWAWEPIPFMIGHVNALEANMLSVGLNNSSDTWWDFVMHTTSIMRGAATLRMGYSPYVTAQYLRPLAPTKVDKVCQEAVIGDVDDIIQFHLMVTDITFLIVSICMVCTVGALTASSMAGITMMGLQAVVLYHLCKSPPITRNDEIPPDCNNRVYRLRYVNPIFKPMAGIGFVYDGVLHAPYHVTFGTPVCLGEKKYAPAYVSREDDLVTYGGTPKFHPPGDAPNVFIVRQTEKQAITCMVPLKLKSGSASCAYVAQSLPGESGSPIMVETSSDANGTTYLPIGLAGRWAEYGSQFIEVATGLTTQAPVQKTPSGIEKVITHPGSGKTFRTIPQLVSEMANHSKPGKTIVTGPTRVVCVEIYDALVRKYPNMVSLNIKGSASKRRPSAKVFVVAHATLARMIMDGDRIAMKPAAVIIDEAHQRDPATHLLRNLSINWIGLGARVVWMSATLDDQCDSGSNFPITDSKIEEQDVYRTIEDCLQKGEKVLVFCTGIKGVYGTQNMAARLSKYNPVQLNSETHTMVAAKTKEDSTKLILSTDIAECGFNANVDAVVDLSKNFKYYAEKDCISGRLSVIDESSRTQRRGRVGRRKAGTYYYCHEPVPIDGVPSEIVDASAYGAAIGWAQPTVPTFHGIIPTTKQVIRSLSEGVSPYTVTITHDQMGVKRDREALRMVFDDLVSKPGEIPGCSEEDCPCRKFAWIDMRDHAYVVAAYNSVQPQPIRMLPPVEECTVAQC